VSATLKKVSQSVNFVAMKIALPVQRATNDDAPHANKHSVVAKTFTPARSVEGRIAHFALAQSSKPADTAGAGFATFIQVVQVVCSNVRSAIRTFVIAAILKKVTVVTTVGSALCARNASTGVVVKELFTVKIAEKREDWPVLFAIII